jgi:uncharacterized protein (TIGR02246 family)
MTTNSGEAAARDLYARLLQAWNQRNAEDYAALFADDGTLIGFDGGQVSGEQVLDHVQTIFGDHPTATYVAKVREVRPLGTDVTMLRAIVGMVPPGQSELNPATNAVQILIAEHERDGWRIVLFQNTPAQHHGRPDLIDEHTAELRQLLSSGTTLA